jgi:hypothetical protein
MAYVLVILVGAAVAAGVYVTTLRSASPDTLGGSDALGGTVSAPAGSYVPVTQGRPDWQTRLTGLLGLIIVVVVTSVVLAVVLYAGISALLRLLGGEGGAAGI